MKTTTAYGRTTPFNVNDLPTQLTGPTDITQQSTEDGIACEDTYLGCLLEPGETGEPNAVVVTCRGVHFSPPRCALWEGSAVALTAIDAVSEIADVEGVDDGRAWWWKVPIADLTPMPGRWRG